MNLDHRIWLGLLTLLNAVLFGVSFTIQHRHSPAASPTPPAPPVIRQTAAPSLTPAPIPSWPAAGESLTPGRDGSAAASPVTIEDIRPPASLEFSTEFAESVRRARAAGIDEVLLAHAVVARFHRQIEAMMYSPNAVQLQDAEREKIRAELVGNLLGAAAYQNWQRSDYMMNHNLAGTDVTAEELDVLIQLDQDRDRKVRELWQSGSRNPRESQQKLNAEYRQQVLSAFGPDRARQLGLP